ncbi:MAG: sporulation sigma factor SigE, partial [Oscillospiraceae bacterium]|nr:sporulation sigma factor SigE [Oscillospiraceae bacterium]
MTSLLTLLLTLRLRLSRAPRLFYIGGSDTLPPPLDKVEEEAAIASMMEGDHEARQALIEHNLRLV